MVSSIKFHLRNLTEASISNDTATIISIIKDCLKKQKANTIIWNSSYVLTWKVLGIVMTNPGIYTFS